MKTCSKCNLSKNESDFKFDYKYLRPSSWCKECFNLWRRENRKKCTQPKPLPKGKKVSQNERVQKKKEFHVDYLKSHPCVVCGEDDIVVLEFNHIDPTTKEYNVSQLLNNNYSISLLKKEISKCEVLCANCHKRKTAKQFNWTKTK